MFEKHKSLFWTCFALHATFIADTVLSVPGAVYIATGLLVTHMKLDRSGACCRDTLEQCRAHGIDEVMRATIMDPIPINYGPWLSMSDEGLGFLQCLMLRNPSQRITAAEALEHPWFTKQFEGAGLSPSAICSPRSGQQEPPVMMSAADDKSDQRNNIVPMPQQQPQHQNMQSKSSLHSKPHALSI